ncbi:MAG: hypothetical protein JNJ44_08165 [Zoogloeaceae bacterium]|nr:hypothetical protein [Zoogloeaceae bacterium]
MKSPTLKRVQTLAGSALLSCGLLTTAVAAEITPLTRGLPPASASATVQPVPFLSGGVGELDRSRIDEMSDAFNLRIITAKTNGEYLTGVHLTIVSEQGKSMLSTVAKGPLLLAQLPPGRYTVTAMSGDEFRQQVVTVSDGRQAIVLLHMADV